MVQKSVRHLSDGTVVSFKEEELAKN